MQNLIDDTWNMERGEDDEVLSRLQQKLGRRQNAFYLKDTVPRVER